MSSVSDTARVVTKEPIGRRVHGASIGSAAARAREEQEAHGIQMSSIMTASDETGMMIHRSNSFGDANTARRWLCLDNEQRHGVMQGSVLLLSQRQISNLVAYCLAYEFEDVLAAVTDAERIDVIEAPSLEFSRRAYKIVRRASGSRKLAHHLAPHPRGKVILERNFELFFPVFSHSYELYSLATVPDWRRRCRKAACFITEVGSDVLPEYLVELLSEFDHVFLGSRYGIEEVARITGRPCTYLPLAVDVLRFAPASMDQPRPIDVCYIGRRSQVTHGALLERAEREQSFYYYDTVAVSGADRKDRTFRVENVREHREMLANIIKRSHFYIANRGNVNRSKQGAARSEISSRFYEGAAAGAVMVGEAPDSEEFNRQFDWPDAVIHMPFDSVDVGRILGDLQRDPDRLHMIRRDNVREAALRHDWLYRIQAVFDALDLQPTERMLARQQQLHQIALRSYEICARMSSGR